MSAYAIGATKAYLYINARYDVAIKSITDALAEAKAAGYWGEKILGSDFNLDIEIIPAPHNYVAGEDTAVLEVIEGRKAWPRQKPPFPVTVGLFGKPTSVNNVETLANVAPIILKGAEWYRKIRHRRESRHDDFFARTMTSIVRAFTNCRSARRCGI